MDDAIRAGILRESDIPKEISQVIGTTTGERLDHFIHDLVSNSYGNLVQTLYNYYRRHFELLPKDYINLAKRGEPEEKVVCDYIGAMTDRFAIARYEEI